MVDWGLIIRILSFPSLFLTKCHSICSQDIALETWSVIEKLKIGWTRDLNKRSDYVLWFWLDTKRW